MTILFSFVDPPSYPEDKILDPAWAELHPEDVVPTQEIQALFHADKRAAAAPRQGLAVAG